jgi:hypothetical protein
MNQSVSQHDQRHTIAHHFVALNDMIAILDHQNNIKEFLVFEKLQE